MTFRLLSPAPAAALAMATIATAAAFDIDASLTLSDPSHIVTVGEDAMIQNDINAASPVIPHDSSATSKEAAVHSLRLKNTDEDDGRVLKYRPKNLRLTAAVSSYDSSKELGILHGTPAQSSFDSYSDGFGVGVRHREMQNDPCPDADNFFNIRLSSPTNGGTFAFLNCVPCDEEQEIDSNSGYIPLFFRDNYGELLDSQPHYDKTDVGNGYFDLLKIRFTIPCPPAMPSKAAKKTKAPKVPKAAKGTKAPKAE